MNSNYMQDDNSKSIFDGKPLVLLAEVADADRLLRSRIWGGSRVLCFWLQYMGELWKFCNYQYAKKFTSLRDMPFINQFEAFDYNIVNLCSYIFSLEINRIAFDVTIGESTAESCDISWIPGCTPWNSNDAPFK